ncbi:DUF6799 domain-containing protein [Hymenobacter jeollabukensis]|uniref:DUF6799 domain-containing protein n=1 Tax=Hymenobacter jeollabukensis TaxID=2025313 RepID=A0A5R8WI56_9BACT|nr:DUF6799 domain-containing protein [Hymenobacter jeollabukensis]TLM87931.1 hypothetical protein FDY95_25140 [Hymenobacter jeollabukensis]
MKFSSTLLTLGLLTLGIAAQAQTRPAPRKAAVPQRPVMKNAGVKDGFMMQDGKVMHTENGHTMPVAALTALPSGVKVQPDGVVIMADGSTAQLQNGDYMSPSGRLTTMRMKAEQDSLAKAAMLDPKGKNKKKKGK